MKKGLLLLTLLISTIGAFAGSIVIEGRYQQRNIYVINSVSADGVGYCAYEVTVNGLITSDEVNSQAFEVDLTIYGLKAGDPVTVVIKHKDGCEPKILNPGALEPAPTFTCTNINISDTGLLTWETTGEQGKLPFQVQQFKWNKWVYVGEVMGNGTSGKNSYRFQCALTSGFNKFRVVQKSYEGELRKSQTTEITSNIAPITFTYDKKLKSVKFSGDTSFEVFNSFGQVVKRGFGSTVDLAPLPKAEYFVSFDNKTEKFIRK